MTPAHRRRCDAERDSPDATATTEITTGLRCITIIQMRTALLILSLPCLIPASGWACSLPVFRYALEHWPADPYRVLIVPAGSWRDSDEAALRYLSEQKQQGANVDFRKWNRSDLPAIWPELRWFGAVNPETMGTRFVVLPPATAVERAGIANRPVGGAAWCRESLEQLLTSPLRQELSARLLQGQIVWLFLESGDPQIDDAIAERVKARIAYEQATLRLPEILPNDRKLLRETSAELSIRFSMLRIRRSDPAEGWLIEQLLSVEGDLRDPDIVGQPMLFPVFGRGRVLYALTGAGITDETIHEAAQFLTGACLCTVKAENPGVDLLLAVSWEDAVRKTQVPVDPPPPLVGLGFPSRWQRPENRSAVATATQVQQEAESVSLYSQIPAVPDAESPGWHGILWLPALFLLGLAAAVASIALVMLRRW
jgi:hypothetical protein